MPNNTTIVTELCTALGLRHPSLEAGLACTAASSGIVSARPTKWPQIWSQLRDAVQANTALASAAFENGQAFANQIMRRQAHTVEWSGDKVGVFLTDLPVDVRADEVFLISCKYGSSTMSNASPRLLFQDLLSGARGRRAPNWYQTVAPDEYHALYRACASHVLACSPHLRFPAHASDLTTDEKTALAQALGEWPEGGEELYLDLARAVGQASADIWRVRLATADAQLHMLWRLIRLSAAQYYLLGGSPGEPTRLKVMSTTDWRRRYKLRDFAVAPDQARGQPAVSWAAEVTDSVTGTSLPVAGYVEVRWSHGRFQKPPEAKIHLNVPVQAVPGYLPWTIELADFLPPSE